MGDQLLGIVDTIAIGTLGPASLAAMTGATTIFIVFVLTLHGLTQGGGILGAQAIGARDYDRFGAIARASAVVPMAVTVVAALAIGLAARPLLGAMLGSLPTLDLGAGYLALRCVSLVPFTISSVAYSIFGAAGDTRFGLILLLAINIVHVPLLFVLALGVGTHHPLGMVGAGISSLISESCGGVFALARLLRHRELRVFSRRHVDPVLVRRVTVLALPEAAYLFLVAAPDIAIVVLLAPLGASAVAAFRVLSLVSDVTWAIPGSVGTAAQILIGQRFGASDIAGARVIDRVARRLAVGASTATGTLVAIVSWPIAYGITLDAALASLAAPALAAHMVTLPLKGYAMAGIARVRAAGDTRFSMLVGTIASAIVLPGVWLAINRGRTGLYAVPIAWTLAWIFWCLATWWRLRGFRWENTRLQ